MRKLAKTSGLVKQVINVTYTRSGSRKWETNFPPGFMFARVSPWMSPSHERLGAPSQWDVYSSCNKMPSVDVLQTGRL